MHKWDKRVSQEIVVNENNTGSKLFDLLIYAGGSKDGNTGTWIGYKQRDDMILAEEVKLLVKGGESLIKTLDNLPYFLGCFPSREPNENWNPEKEYTPLIYALILRIPIVAETIIELSSPNELLIGDPLTLAKYASTNYAGHRKEYKRIVKKLMKKI